MHPQLSKHFQSRKPSSVRLAQLAYQERTDSVDAINTAIGNVTLPMHPAMIERLHSLEKEFVDGVVKYAPTAGEDATKAAFSNTMRASGLNIDDVFIQISDGGSQAMELISLGVADKDESIMLVEPVYPNYYAFAQRGGRKVVTVRRELDQNGEFTFPDSEDIAAFIEEYKPKALVVIPYDNPTGQLISQKKLQELARICVAHNMWFVSDEAYRELHYGDNQNVVSVWNISEDDVPGITGRRISVETASKVWNACGIRVGALVTDNKGFYTQSVAEYTANLSPNSLGQSVFAALANESESAIQNWYSKQRTYYKTAFETLYAGLTKELSDAIISQPQAALYLVVDVKNMVDETFSIQDFVLYCAQEGKVSLEGKDYTLLVAPMNGFYLEPKLEDNPGRTQMRIAAVEQPERLALVPTLLKQLLQQYLNQ